MSLTRQQFCHAGQSHYPISNTLNLSIYNFKLIDYALKIGHRVSVEVCPQSSELSLTCPKCQPHRGLQLTQVVTTSIRNAVTV